MRRKRFKEEQIVKVLKEAEGGQVPIAETVQTWLSGGGTKTHFIDPASPWQNAFGESFNDKLRTECLNLEVFETLSKAEVIVTTWRRQYNQVRPHSSLAYLTPAEYRTRWARKLSPSPAPRSLGSLSSAGGRKGKLFVNGLAMLQPVESYSFARVPRMGASGRDLLL